jgi:hypothetical protein
MPTPYGGSTMSFTSSIGSGSSAVQNALLGINRGMANFAQDTQAVAQGGAVTDALVDAQQQALNVKASATALSIADQTLGTLLDIKA